MQKTKLELRPLLTKDEEFIQKLFNKEGVYNSGFLNLFYPMSDLQVKSFLNHSLSSQTEKNFVITRDGEDIGFSQISAIDYINRKAELGVLLDPHYQNKGIGSEIFGSLISMCFNQLNLHKVECEFIANNIRSQSILKRLGFIEEGNLKDSVFRDGIFHNKKIFGLTKDLYLK